jgi:(p)ppGpp synthase/HD superfamily hydrolase
MKTLYEKISSLPLKKMDGSLLAAAIMELARERNVARLDDLSESISIASYLHRDDTRANRGGLPRDTYITHPLRNTLRLLRYYHIVDVDILIAAVLHDTVEDHPNEIVEDLAGQDATGLSEEDVRMRAISFLSGRFGAEVGRIVLAVSNPINPDAASLTKDEKRAIYAQHVEEAITNDFPVFLVKFADFYDNAGSLHYTSANKSMTIHLVKKYTPLISVFREQAKAIQDRISEDGFYRFNRHLIAVQSRLDELAVTFNDN